MSNITDKIKHINRVYSTLDLLKKFLATRKGREFINNFDKASIDELCYRFEAPKIKCVIGYIDKRNLYKSAMKELRAEQDPKKKGIVHFRTHIHKKKTDGKLKLPKNLTKYEQKLLNKRDQWVIKRSKNGSPIIKSESFVRNGELAPRLLYDKETGLPIYKYTPKPKAMGIAYKCNAYANLKIDKWLRRNPEPNEVEIKMHLFPEELMASWRTRKNIAIETIRNEVASKYYKVPDPTVNLRLYETGESLLENGTRIVWENECDPYVYGYPLCNIPNSSSTIEQKLRSAMLHASPNIRKLKVYDKLGSLKAEVRRGELALQFAA